MSNLVHRMNDHLGLPTGDVVLVVDDDTAVLRSVDRTLRDAGFEGTRLCGDSRDVQRLVESEAPDVILLDLIMPHVSGEEVLANLRSQVPDTPAIIVTALDDLATAVRCVKGGAYDYLTKPLDPDRLIATVRRALESHRLHVENDELRRRITAPGPNRPEVFDGIVTQSPAMLGVFSYVEAIAKSPDPVLIVGETGVGKELIAKALHKASGREGELVSVNVAGLDETAFADTLFGHARGAFTGANQPRDGLVQRAAGGSLLLDEIGDLDGNMQTKLLRLVQEREYLMLGSDLPRRSECRIVAATNRDLRVRLRDGRFREDLYYRLHSHLVRVPPLREHIDDVPLLVQHFLKDAAASLGKAVPTAPKELFVHLSTYPFPGNVRELRAMILDAVARHEKGMLSLGSFHNHMDGVLSEARKEWQGAVPSRDGMNVGSELPTLTQATDLLIREALKRASGNQAIAARLLGVSRRTINRYVARDEFHAGDGSSPASPRSG